MNVLYCGDRNISEGLFLSALSLMRQTDQALHVYVLTMQISRPVAVQPVDRGLMDYLQRILQNRNPESSVQVCDVSALFEQEPPAANLYTRFTPCCMLRLYADLIEEIPDKILYLDTDVIARKDPSGMYDISLHNAQMAGVLDNYGKWWFHRHLLQMDYFNSGVLLLNMKQIRQDGLFARCRKMCAARRMFMPDQSSLHKLADKVVFVPRCYNEQKQLRPDTVLQHFTTQLKFFPCFHTQCVKPWEFDKVHQVLHLYEYDDLFQEYTRLRREYAARRKLCPINL